MSAPSYTADQLIALVRLIGSGPQTLLALALADGHSTTQPLGRLAERLLQTTANITGLLDGLESGGWAERERKSSDRRVITVRLTEKGLAAIALATNGGASQP